MNGTRLVPKTDVSVMAAAQNVGRQNIWLRLRRGLVEFQPHLEVDTKRRSCGVAIADVG
jgi:hypothetical protein